MNLGTISLNSDISKYFSRIRRKILSRFFLERSLFSPPRTLTITLQFIYIYRNRWLKRQGMQLVRVSLPGDKNSSTATGCFQVQKREMEPERRSKSNTAISRVKIGTGAPLAPTLGTTDTNRSPGNSSLSLSLSRQRHTNVNTRLQTQG